MSRVDSVLLLFRIGGVNYTQIILLTSPTSFQNKRIVLRFSEPSNGEEGDVFFIKGGGGGGKGTPFKGGGGGGGGTPDTGVGRTSPGETLVLDDKTSKSSREERPEKSNPSKEMVFC